MGTLIRRSCYLLIIVLALCYASNGTTLAAQQQHGPTYIGRPRPIGTIEFIEASGVDRWRVKLDGQDAYLRIRGTGCSFMGEIYKGMVTPLYDDITLVTSGGKQCTITAIER